MKNRQELERKRNVHNKREPITVAERENEEGPRVRNKRECTK